MCSFWSVLVCRPTWILQERSAILPSSKVLAVPAPALTRWHSRWSSSSFVIWPLMRPFLRARSTSSLLGIPTGPSLPAWGRIVPAASTHLRRVRRQRGRQHTHRALELGHLEHVRDSHLVAAEAGRRVEAVERRHHHGLAIEREVLQQED